MVPSGIVPVTWWTTWPGHRARYFRKSAGTPVSPQSPTRTTRSETGMRQAKNSGAAFGWISTNRVSTGSSTTRSAWTPARCVGARAIPSERATVPFGPSAAIEDPEADLARAGPARDHAVAVDPPDRGLEPELGPGVGGGHGHLAVELAAVHHDRLGLARVEEELAPEVRDDPRAPDAVPDGPVRDPALGERARREQARALDRVADRRVLLEDEGREPERRGPLGRGRAGRAGAGHDDVVPLHARVIGGPGP